MPSKKRSTSSSEKNISITGDVKDSVVIAGDNNQTIIQKFFNIFKSDSETLEQRNRRILLGHVENAWIKGVLDASLHGAALLDLGIKQDPEAVTKYPWAIKKESTDETLPAGTSMLEIFDSIGMGRSLLILGAPGSGKTTMLLELARQLIQHAREDVTYPIPMVFNLASWTEKLALADWLAQELNNLYSVPRKTAPDWVNGNKLLLLLDGLDEVRQESRAKCVEAINAFRKEHGLTSLAVCSRSQDYADLNTKLSFEGAIEVQPLTQEQIHVFFNHFGDEMAGIKQALEKDSALREMTETPLFLSIMIMAYRNKQDIEILASKDQNAQRKHLFGSYIERMFERTHLKNMPFQKQNILCWLSWLASKMIENNATPYLFEDMQPKWVNHKERTAYEWIALYRLIVGLSVSLFGGLFIGLIAGLSFGLIQGTMTGLAMGLAAALDYGLKFSLIFGLITGVGIILGGKLSQIKMTDSLVWDWKRGKTGLIIGSIGGLAGGMVIGSVVAWIFWQLIKQYPELATDTISIGSLSKNVIFVGIIFGLLGGLSGLAVGGIGTKQIDHTMFPGERISSSTKNFFYAFLLAGLSIWLIFGLIGGLSLGEGPMGMIIIGAYIAPSAGLLVGLILGGLAVVQHYTLRVILTLKKFLPFRIPLFLDHCVDLIFLRRVGGGYIFVHRLLMEHFAEMYVETPTSKGNQK